MVLLLLKRTFIGVIFEVDSRIRFPLNLFDVFTTATNDGPDLQIQNKVGCFKFVKSKIIKHNSPAYNSQKKNEKQVN